MMEFFSGEYGKRYAPNSRETVRRQTVHQFVQAGMVVPNPDDPSRPTNSPNTVYQIEKSLLAVLRTFGAAIWTDSLRGYLASNESLKKRYAREREMRRLPVRLRAGTSIDLSPGGQSVLIKAIIDEFCSRFTPAAMPIYVGDTQKKWAYFDEESLSRLGIKIEEHGKMPDVVVFHADRRWLVLIEAVTSHGPVSPKRRVELHALFRDSKVGLVFVSAFPDQKTMGRYLRDISWESEVWVAEHPSHLIHFNGERFLGPYDEVRPQRRR